VIGRYAQSDPIGLAGGLNTYLYAGANPLARIDPFGLIDLKIPGATGEISVHANPGPEAVPFPGPGSRVEHNPPHVHLGHNQGPQVRTDTWQPLSAEDARNMTSKQRKFIRDLSEQARGLIRARQASVFKYGKYFAVLAALPKVGLDSVTQACQSDPFFCLENTPWVFDGIAEMYNNQTGTCQ
jgi:uncharacterized protein RhaS with RHS repeats